MASSSTRQPEDNSAANSPPIHYATASDGVRIAYWAIGEGPALIHMGPLPYSHIRMEWALSQSRRYYQDLGASMKLIRYDCRGAGLSDRDVTDYSTEAYGRDVLAIAEREGLERFALLGFGYSGAAAIQFAADHPDFVSHLVLWCAFPRAADYGRAPRVKAMRALQDEDWNFWTRAEALQLSEYKGGAISNWFVEYVRESVTEAANKAASAELRKIDVTDVMARVQTPTLVLHRTGIANITVEMAREIASTMPNARLILVDGTWIAPYLGGGAKEIVAAITDHVIKSPPASRAAASGVSPSVLTARETEVLRLVASGKTSRAISDELSLSVRTVGRHITNIYAKIGARTRADATSYAIRHRIT